MLYNIKVKHLELRTTNPNITDLTKWKVTQDTTYTVAYSLISNMLESEPFFTKTGGKMVWKKKTYRKLGTLPTEVEVTSPCKKVMKILKFDYAQAKQA